jgi:cytoskeleton protein RodZ
MTTETSAPGAASDETVPESSRQGPGRLIRLARERARLGVPELAALTKLAPATLEALERDDFSVLSEPVYVRGYYRKCAKALAMSEQELLGAYEKLVAPRAPTAPTKLLLGGSSTGSSLKKNRRKAGSPWWLWLIGVAVIVAVAAWFLREEPGEHRGAPPDAPRPAPSAEAPPVVAPAAAPAAEAGAKPLSTNELSTTPSERGVAAPAAAEPAPAPAKPTLATALSAPPPVAVPPPAPAAAPVPAVAPVVTAAAPAAAEPAGPNALKLGFKATSWVRIEDAGGKVLLAGVIQGGDRQVLNGRAPYSVFLGNGPGVTIEYQGKSVDVAHYTRAKDNTARFTVPGGD